MAVSQRILAWVTANLEAVCAVLRWIRPIVVFGGNAFVTRYEDVEEVLARDGVFLVPYAEKMIKVTDGSNFFLGMQDTPEYTRDVSNMRLVVRRDDIQERIAAFVTRSAEAILAAADGRIDVVQGLTRVLPARLIGDYFGTPGWDEDEFIDAATVMFQYLFYPDEPQLERRAMAAAARTREHLDGIIAARMTQPGARDDVLQRCLAMQQAGLPGMSALEIRNNLIGLIIGAIPTTSKCAALTLDFLLDKPELLAGARAAALADDDHTLVQYVLEALRLRPFAPGITRICAESYVLARRSLRATRIPKGAVVLAVTQSAMMDWRRIKRPAEFRLDRPAYAYLHFGAGMHRCFGRHINLIQIPRIVKAVLKREGLRRAPGAAGRLQSAGPFPTHLTVEWG